MTYRGHVEKGVILLDDIITLPDGAVVNVTLESAAAPAAAEEKRCSLEEKLAAIWADVPAAEWAKLPADLSDQLDHYIYGNPKQ